MNLSFRRLSLLVAFGVLLAPAAQAQSGHKTRKATTAKTATAPREAAMGTFQLVPQSDKLQVALTTDALAEIERRRHDNDEVSWQVSPYARVRILPRRVIEAPGFQPLPAVAPVASR